MIVGTVERRQRLGTQEVRELVEVKGRLEVLEDRVSQGEGGQSMSRTS